MIELIALYLTLSVAEQQGINYLACAQPEADTYVYTLGEERGFSFVYDDNSELNFNSAFDNAIVYDAEGKEVYHFDF